MNAGDVHVGQKIVGAERLGVFITTLRVEPHSIARLLKDVPFERCTKEECEQHGCMEHEVLFKAQYEGHTVFVPMRRDRIVATLEMLEQYKSLRAERYPPVSELTKEQRDQFVSDFLRARENLDYHFSVYHLEKMRKSAESHTRGIRDHDARHEAITSFFAGWTDFINSNVPKPGTI